MNIAHIVFIAAHVDDLIMVGSSSQLYEVVSEMKHHFNIKVTLPLSSSAAPTYVGGRYLRPNDAVWELPTTRYKDSMLEEHGKTCANPVVTRALARDNDDEDEDKNTESPGEWLARVSSLLHADQTSLSTRTVWRASLAKLADFLTSKRLQRSLCGTLNFGLKWGCRCTTTRARL